MYICKSSSHVLSTRNMCRKKLDKQFSLNQPFVEQRENDLHDRWHLSETVKAFEFCAIEVFFIEINLSSCSIGKIFKWKSFRSNYLTFDRQMFSIEWWSYFSSCKRDIDEKVNTKKTNGSCKRWNTNASSKQEPIVVRTASSSMNMSRHLQIVLFNWQDLISEK